MLENLAAINWSALQGCYQPATEVPLLLRSLLSPIDEIRSWAMDELTSAIWHQGTVYQATPIVVPFLFELLESDEVECKVELVCLLATLSDTSVHDQGYSDAVLREITQRFDSIYPYLRCSDESVRLTVVEALARIPEIVTRLKPDLAIAYRDETDPYVRRALGELIEGTDQM